jgi:hypothetical protein
MTRCTDALHRLLRVAMQQGLDRLHMNASDFHRRVSGCGGCCGRATRFSNPPKGQRASLVIRISPYPR